MSKADPQVLAALRGLTFDGLAQDAGPLVLGICGSQGSGKSTLAEAMADDLAGKGLKSAVLSLDDLYLTRAERERLAKQVHPLLITRGPPGTHDVALGIEVLDALRSGTPVRMPRFAKAKDDRCDSSAWPEVAGQCDVLIFEGWCLGARAQEPEALAQPLNELEMREDADGRWRSFINEALAGPYQDLFARIDRLVLLQAPAFEVVLDWRQEQEEDLRARLPDAPGLMSWEQIARFIAHYERITRHILSEMPARADLVVQLDARRSPEAILTGSRREAGGRFDGPAR
ncbi:MAG: kinase [Alphaproteobacteria bacterium]|nr:kinase [Alphaproteobacteria bacterium]